MDDENLSQSLSDLSNSLASLDPTTSTQMAFDVLETRKRIDAYIYQDAQDMTKPILQSFLDHLPSEGKRVLCKYIMSKCHQDDLRVLADHLNKAILSPMKACGGKTPSTSPSPFDDLNDGASDMVDSCNRKDLRKAKELCLEREDYRCAITGRYAMDAVGKFPSIPDKDIKKYAIRVDASHILPFAFGAWNTDEEAQRKANTWTTLGALFPLIRDVIKADQINEGRNLIVMTSQLNVEFGKLTFALEPTDEEDVYQIVTYEDFPGGEKMHFHEPNNELRLVKFKKHRGSHMELPSRILLSTHAAIARILHASGMAEIIDKALDDADGMRGLASDGGTDLQFILPALLAY